MSKEFSVVISEATNNDRDYCIHFLESGKERLMIHCQFMDQPEIDKQLMDDLMTVIAKSIAGNKLEQAANKKKKLWGNKKAKEVTNRIIEKLKKG